jgi:hypothetical protein
MISGKPAEKAVAKRVQSSYLNFHWFSTSFVA